MMLVSAARGAGLLAAALVLSSSAQAQSPDAFWTDVAEASVTTGATPAGRTLRLDRAAMARRLEAAPLETLGAGAARASVAVDIPLPLPDGTTEWFRVVESPVMAPELQARFPEIRTYAGQGRDTPSATARISLTPAGFAAMAHTPAGVVYVDLSGGAYRSAFHGDAGTADPSAVRGADRVLEAPLDARLEALSAERAAGVQQTRNGRFLRTYRLALTATGEYTQFFGGTVAGALAAQAAAVNRVNEIYERDLAIRFQIIADNDKIIYLNSQTDPFTPLKSDGTNGGVVLRENRINTTLVIGNANYDIGHLFSVGFGGIAALGSVCTTSKAEGLTATPNPTGDAFYVDYVAHEMGHQFSANHTFNASASNCGDPNRNAATAYEPGSGTTIMGYAGICSPQNTQNFSDPYFHAVSIQEIVGFVTGGNGSLCGTRTPTDNDIPVVTPPPPVTVPVGTPFRLVGSATDATPGALTYTWEEFDLGPAGSFGSATPPFFRSYGPKSSPVRYFPSLDRVLANAPPRDGEALPVTATTLQRLNFRLTVRDNRAGGGAVADTTASVIVDSRAGPFRVTSFNAAGTSVPGGSTQTVTWAVARTALFEADTPGPDADGVDVENVQILYAADGGTVPDGVLGDGVSTFNTVLLASTPNTGFADVVIPDIVTSRGRILVIAIGNSFFDVNDADFTVTQGTSAEARPAAEAGLSAVRPNPAAGRASVTLSAPAGESVSVVVLDALGREVARLHDGPAASEQVFSVDVSALPPGVYVVRARGARVQAARRFTVVR